MQATNAKHCHIEVNEFFGFFTISYRQEKIGPSYI